MSFIVRRKPRGKLVARYGKVEQVGVVFGVRPSGKLQKFGVDALGFGNSLELALLFYATGLSHAEKNGAVNGPLHRIVHFIRGQIGVVEPGCAPANHVGLRFSSGTRYPFRTYRVCFCQIEQIDRRDRPTRNHGKNTSQISRQRSRDSREFR